MVLSVRITALCGALLALMITSAHAGVICYDSSSYAHNFVSAMQERLTQAGFNPGPVDGKWGPKGKHALGAYQSAKGLKVTNDVNAATLRALFGPTVSPESYGLRPNRHLPSDVFNENCK